MHIIYQSTVHELEAASCSTQSSSEEMNYVARLREVEKALLCQALGGQLPQPGSQQRLQYYLDGKINRAEAFQSVYSSAEHILPA